jgi:hypothetical protein
VSALVLDAGALVAIDRGDRSMIARLAVAQQHGMELRSNAMVVAQVWRDRQGRQVSLARLLRAVDVRVISHQDGRQAGVLLGLTGTTDPIDAIAVEDRHSRDLAVIQAFATAITPGLAVAMDTGLAATTGGRPGRN